MLSFPAAPATSFHCSAWPPAQSACRLGENDVHVWCVALGDFSTKLPQLHAVLSRDEQVRAGKFHARRDRDHYVACRGLLRELLGRYLDRSPDSLAFTYGPLGKPALTASAWEERLHFNASHSGDVAVYAVTSVGAVGVDVEQLRAVPDLDEIALRFFSPTEAAHLLAVPSDQRIGEFFALWTAKEAFLKATGDGLGGGLATPIPADWHLERLSPAPLYTGAIAYKPDTACVSVGHVSLSPREVA